MRLLQRIAKNLFESKEHGNILPNLIKLRPVIMVINEIDQISTKNETNEHGSDENNNLHTAETKNKLGRHYDIILPRELVKNVLKPKR